jgi:lipoprotein-releasing system permease protein
VQYQTFIALRYLKFKRREAFISVLTLISIIGTAVGVTSLVVAQALTTGTHKAIVEKIVSNSAHLLIYDSFYTEGIPDFKQLQKEIETVPRVKATAGVVFGWGLIKSKQSSFTAAFIYGVEISEISKINNIMQDARMDRKILKEDNWILLAAGLARKLHINNGDLVKVVTAGGALSPMGMIPVPRHFKVAGTFQTGMWQSEESWCYIPRAKAQKLFNMPERVNVIQASVSNVDEAADVAKEINKRYSDRIMAYDWAAINKSFYSALKLEKLILFMTLGLIVLVASLNIISTLVVLVVEKRKSIGVLRAMGADRRGVMLTFILQGLIIGLIGTILGLILGIGMSLVLDHFQLIQLDPSVYPIKFVRFKVEFGDCLWVVILALSISLLATLYPSYRASRMNPAENLRNE